MIIGRPERLTTLGIVGVTLLALSACSSGISTGAPGGAATQNIPTTAFSQQIHDSLPQKIRDAGELKTASILFPPYAKVGSDGKTVEGLNVDMVHQLESVLGVKVSFEPVPAVADIATGFSSGRFDVSIAPTSDLPSTEQSFDFVDWLTEFVVFLVPKENQRGVTSLATACGATVATLQGGTAEKVLKTASAACPAQGKPAITINTYADQNTAVLAVKSGRADAAFSSQIPLTFYASTDPNLMLTGVNQLNGFPKFWIGAYVPKGSPLTAPMLAAFNAMKESGAYAAMLKSYGISDNAIDTFGINLATRGAG